MASARGVSHLAEWGCDVFREGSFFCYNTAPEGKPTASSGAPIDSTAILSSAGENLATLDLVRHDVGCVGLQGRAFLRCVPCCAGYTPTFVFVMKIGDFIVFHSESRT